MGILVTGATGLVGGVVAHTLAAAGVAVRVLVRTTAQAATLDGAEVVQGSFEDGASLTRALEGIDTVFLTGRDGPDLVSLQGDVLRHALQAGVTHVVRLSAIGARRHSPIGFLRDHRHVDKALQAGRLGWTVLQPQLFMQNLLRFADEVWLQRRLSAPMAEQCFPLVDARDVGAAAAAVLREPKAHAGKVYQLTGPCARSYAEVAEALSAVMSETVVYEPVSPETFEARLLRVGMPPWRAFDLAHMGSAYSMDDRRVLPDLETLLGRKPTSIETFLQDHRSLFAG